MATKTIEAIQWTGDLDAVRKFLHSENRMRAIKTSKTDSGRLRITKIGGDIYVRQDEWLTKKDLLVLDNARGRTAC